MGAVYLTDLADVLRAAGLRVVELDGWERRARSSGGYDGGPWCVMWHHTASSTSPANDAAYIATGAEAAPLANLLLARDGGVWVCAAGATNTNGSGGPLGMSRGVVPVDSMNTHAIGVEMANAGTGERWPQAQVDAAFTLSLALCAAYGLAPDDAAPHSEWAPGRKIDNAVAWAVEGPWQPSSINTSGSWSPDDLRAELRRRATSSPTPPLPPIGDEMEPVLIASPTTIALLYGSGKLVPLDGESLTGFALRYGDALPVSQAVFDLFAASSS